MRKKWGEVGLSLDNLDMIEGTGDREQGIGDRV
jgi:hypothetical protein